MKKSLFFLASAALVLASCNNDVKLDENTSLVTSNQPKEIAFKVLAKTPKRAAIVTADFPADNTMEVAAYMTNPTAKDYFAKTTFNKSGDTWKGGKFWPLAASKLNFFAVSGANVTASHITIAEELANATVAYTTTNGYASNSQKDIMYAFGRGEVTQSGNLFNYPTVAMEFKHALALIDFRVKAATATEAAAITVNSITLKGATYNGTLTLTNDAYVTAATGDVTTTVSWVAGDDVEAQAVSGISSGTAIGTDYARIGEGLMIIPGTGFTSFVINYTCEGVAYNFEYTPSPAVTTTTANTKYIYDITFKMHEIEIAPTVAEWADGGNKEITIPNMVYGQNYTVNATKDAQTLSYTITGFTAESGNKYKVTVGGTDAAQVTVTTPSSTGAAATATADVTATILANESGADKTFTLTIQEVTSTDANVGTPTVLTVTQAH